MEPQLTVTLNFTGAQVHHEVKCFLEIYVNCCREMLRSHSLVIFTFNQMYADLSPEALL